MLATAPDTLMTTPLSPGVEAGLPRVLHALAPGAAGGLESVVRLLASGWADSGGEVALSISLDTGSALPPGFRALEARGVRLFVHELPPRGYLRERRAVLAACARFTPAIVHTHGYRADLIAGSAARRAGMARVSTLHGFTGGDWKNRLYERLQLRTLRRYDAVVAVSRPIVSRLASLGMVPPQVALIPNAWAPLSPPLGRSEARLALGIPEEAMVVAWVGRLSHEKGPDLFLAALARLARPAVMGVVFGSGRLRAALEAQAAALGLSDRIRWLGLVPDAGRLVGAFDAFVMSSRTEGTPIALFEAMAARSPIVATAVGGIPDVVEGGREALLVPAEDPAALAAALAETLDDRPAAGHRALLAAARLERDFGLAPWLERHRVLYQSILACRGGRAA